MLKKGYTLPKPDKEQTVAHRHRVLKMVMTKEVTKMMTKMMTKVMKEIFPIKKVMIVLKRTWLVKKITKTTKMAKITKIVATLRLIQCEVRMPH